MPPLAELRPAASELIELEGIAEQTSNAVNVGTRQRTMGRPWRHLSPAIERAHASRERPGVVVQSQPPQKGDRSPAPAPRYIDVNPPFAPTEITDYDSLHALLRARADQLRVSRETIDAVTGLPEGYCGKALGRRQVKRLGHISLGLMLDVLCVRLIAVPDDEAFARNRLRLVQRDDKNSRSASAGHKAKSKFRMSGTITAQLLDCWPAAAD